MFELRPLYFVVERNITRPFRIWWWFKWYCQI